MFVGSAETMDFLRIACDSKERSRFGSTTRCSVVRGYRVRCSAVERHGTNEVHLTGIPRETGTETSLWKRPDTIEDVRSNALRDSSV